MFILKNWYLCPWENDKVYAAGFVFDNPKFGQGHSITTSVIQKCETREEAIVVTTFSGSHYEMKFESCGQQHEENFRKLAGILGLSTETINLCLEKQKETRKDLKEKADKLLKPHELFMQIAGYHAIVAFYKQDKETREASIIDHIGMFQDSVLIQDSENVDFRFFPKEFYCIEPYHWSDGLERIHFENIGANAEFKGTNKTIHLPTNSITVVEASLYQGEGLFSPDCVNGKGIYSSWL